MDGIASDAAQPSQSVADTIALVVDQRLLRDCIGPQLASCLPSFNLRLCAWPDDPAGLGDRCSLSLVVLWVSRPTDCETAFESTLEAVAAKQPIAILSDFTDPTLVARAVTHGVRGYFTTAMSLAELAAAIHFVAGGGTYVPSSVLGVMTTSGPLFHENDADQKLSRRQLDVLERLQEGKPNKIIAYELGMAEGTVKVHVRTMMRKLNARNRTEVVLKTRHLRRNGGFRRTCV